MTGTDIQIRSGRSARSLPEGRSLALRERERSEGSDERSRPRPAESLAGAPQAQITREAEATLGRSARSLPEGRSLTLRERERCEGSGTRSSPHPGEPRAGAPQAQITREAGATLVVEAIGEPGAGLSVAVDAV